ncbi:hypothetical protein BDZ97DRAFT_1915488 [Flammula alnicola]|nr:hypothetical protein BDZ97DRAFT_1915488 [Flammula alnicola]
MDLMQRSVQSLLHSFALSNFITNITHHPSRALLRRMLMFCYMGLIENVIHVSDPFRHHLPDIKTMDGVVNLLSLAAVNFLGNVLDFRTYSAPNQGEEEDASDEQIKLLGKYDRCNLTGDERSAMCYARGVAVATFEWICCHCTVTGPDGQAVHDLPSLYITKLLKALLRYKAIAMQKRLVGAPHCNTTALRKQITNVVQCDGPLSSFWEKEKDGIVESSLSFGQTDGYSVSWSAAGFKGVRLPDKVIHSMGTTGFNKKWRSGEEYRLLREVSLASSDMKQEDPRPLKRFKSHGS